MKTFHSCGIIFSDTAMFVPFISATAPHYHDGSERLSKAQMGAFSNSSDKDMGTACRVEGWPF